MVKEIEKLGMKQRNVMPPVNLLIKPASGICNMKCDYCFYCDEAVNRKQASYGFMTEKTLKNVIRKTVLSAEGSCTIAFQGGEPTLIGLDFYKKVIEYVKQYNKNKIEISYALQTNGYQITEEWCEFFKNNSFLIGLSIDGTQDTHDTYRHNHKDEGTYVRIIEAAKMFDIYNVQYNILTVINNKTAKNIKIIYKEYKKMGWLHQQYIACLDPFGEEKGKQEYSLLPEIYGQFLIDLFDLWYSDFLKNEQPYIRQFENYVMIMIGYLAESCEQRGICGIQNVIEADGSVYPCDFYVLDEYYLGNLNENSMFDINHKRNKIKFVERSYKISAECKLCKYHKICKGGCQRNRVLDTEKEDYHNYFCKGYKLFFDSCYEKLIHVTKIVKSRQIK